MHFLTRIINLQVGPDVTFTILLAWLTAFDGKIIKLKDAAAGYGNTGLLTVIFLYMVAEGVTQTGGLELIMNYVLGRSRSVHWALVRSMFPVMFLSAFLNNTPCVTFMIPILLSWSRRCGVPPKKLLIPLSYAAVLGGTCTSIGTSTNLVIDKRYAKKDAAEARFGMFDIAAYGVPYALWGALRCGSLFYSPPNPRIHLLVHTQTHASPRQVKKSSEVVGKTVSAAGLRGIPGLYVLSVDRADGSSVEANDYLYKIQPDDIIWIAAEVAAVGFLSKFPGLELVQQEQVDKTGTSILYRHLVQAAVSHKGPLVGNTVRDMRFRSAYNAAVVAVHRYGVRVPLKVQDIVLQGGDVLLLSCSTRWTEEHKHDKAFVLLQAVPDSSPPKRRSMIIGVLLLLGMVLTQIVGGLMDRELIHLWPVAVLTAALMLITGCMNADQARKSIMWDVYLTIAAAFGVSAALESTGVAGKVANAIIGIGNRVGGTGPALIAIYIATAVMSELLTNNAAGAIMYPIAAIAGEKLMISPRDVSIAIMLGASAGFVNPFSYQCNLMVYAAGNYSVREFAIIGAPFQ
ncbi:hypothetical protein VOLCADRAFT_70819, partial [Volvox carteri f. nagariensis]